MGRFSRKNSESGERGWVPGQEEVASFGITAHVCSSIIFIIIYHYLLIITIIIIIIICCCSNSRSIIIIIICTLVSLSLSLSVSRFMLCFPNAALHNLHLLVRFITLGLSYPPPQPFIRLLLYSITGHVCSSIILICVVRRVRDRRKLLHYSPRLERARVRQVIPPDRGRVLARQMPHVCIHK